MARKKTTVKSPPNAKRDGASVAKAHSRLVHCKIATASADAIEDRPSTRLRAFLARTRPITGCECPNVYWEGRSLIESLALSYEIMTVDDYEWTLPQCALVLSFLQAIEPAEGHCFCGGFDSAPYAISTTCGHHLILQQLQDQMDRLSDASETVREVADG